MRPGPELRRVLDLLPARSDPATFLRLADAYARAHAAYLARVASGPFPDMPQQEELRKERDLTRDRLLGIFMEAVQTRSVLAAAFREVTDDNLPHTPNSFEAFCLAKEIAQCDARMHGDRPEPPNSEGRER